ncbi:hypothetical protein [Brevibacillus reuszeri]|uniref:hypothetical protein n=1 Tax=Brevibacillus reuszeri TaxID=54915 RepID=UPI000CCC7E29|nr:hypothetical protein [Brevibacillus reuszeri]
MMGGISNKNVFNAVRNFSTTLTVADQGKAVSMTGNNQVGVGTDGATFVGVLERVEKDGACRVRSFGNVEALYTGTIVLGDRVVVSGDGKVKAAGTAVNGRGFVSAIDATAKIATIEL